MTNEHTGVTTDPAINPTISTHKEHTMEVLNSTAREGDLDINAVAALDEAETILEGFFNPVDNTLKFALNPDSVIEAYSETNRIPLGQATALYKAGLMTLCTGATTRIQNGRVSLDTEGLAGGRTWSVPGPVRAEDADGTEHTEYDLVIPQVVFCSLTLDSAMFEAGQCEAMAVHYLPDTKVVTKIRQRDGVPYQVSNDWFEGGYIGIAKTYSSVTEAQSDRDELVRAVRNYGKESASARQDDVFEVEASKSAPAGLPAIL